MLQLIYLFMAGSLFLLTFLLINNPQKTNKKANFWFACFVFCVACVFVDDCFVILNLREKYPQAEELTNLPLFLLAPTLFFSVLYFTNPQKRFKQTDYLHFLPFVLYLLLPFVLIGSFGENFYEFINRYRVEASKKLLTDAKFQHLNMVGIAFEAGFNSKTAFNTAFKKTTGQTPSEFRKTAN